MKHTYQKGFTIVELLIVIVVIGILAAITIVAFNGVQNRGYDTSIKSDLKNIGQKYELYRVDNDSYPFGSLLNDGTAFRLDVGRNAYDMTSSYQLINCTSTTTVGSDYAVLATSKSGKKFYVSSLSGGVQEYTGSGTWVTPSSCANVLPGSTGNGAGMSSGAWRTWTSSS